MDGWEGLIPQVREAPDMNDLAVLLSNGMGIALWRLWMVFQRRRDTKVDQALLIKIQEAVDAAVNGDSRLSTGIAIEGKSKKVVLLEVEPISPLKRVSLWLGGVVVGSLIPFFWGFISGAHGEGNWFYTAFGRGDLFLLSIVLIVAGFIEIAPRIRFIGTDMTLTLLILGAVPLIMVGIARYGTAEEKLSKDGLRAEDMPHSVSWISLGLYLFAALHSTVCVYKGAKSE